MIWPLDPDTVQHVSLPLELLGLFLALLEMFYPVHADAMEAAFDKNRLVLLKGFQMVLTARYHVALVAIMVPLAAGWTYFFAKHPILAFAAWSPSIVILVLGNAIGISDTMFRCILLLWAMPVLLVSIVVEGFMRLVGRIIALFDYLGKGRATGGIGLTLGCIGLLGEVYQVIMIDRNGDPKTVVEWWSVYATVLIAIGVVAFFVNRIVMREHKSTS